MMGAITTNTMGVHIVGMFFFKTDTNQIKELLNLLIHNLTGKEFASYSTITPENANLPADVLRSIPLIAIENSPTGSKPKSLWEQISDAIGGAITSAVNFIANAVIAVANFIAHAAEVIAQVAMQVFNTVASVVKTAVEVVKKVVSGLIDGLIKIAEGMFNKVIKPIIDALRAYLADVGAKLEAIYHDYKSGKAPSKEHIKALMNAILPPEVMNFIMAMSIIYTVINIVVTFGIPGIGTIVAVAIGSVIGAVVAEYVIPNLGFLKGLWDGAQEALANGLKSLMDTLKGLGMSVVDWTAQGLNTVALAAGWLLSKLKGSVFEKKSVVGTVFGVLSILAGFEQHNKWVGVAGVLMGFVSLIFGAWSVVDTVETTLDGILFAINLLAGMNGLGFSAIGLVI